MSGKRQSPSQSANKFARGHTRRSDNDGSMWRIIRVVTAKRGAHNRWVKVKSKAKATRKSPSLSANKFKKGQTRKSANDGNVWRIIRVKSANGSTHNRWVKVPKTKKKKVKTVKKKKKTTRTKRVKRKRKPGYASATRVDISFEEPSFFTGKPSTMGVRFSVPRSFLHEMVKPVYSTKRKGKNAFHFGEAWIENGHQRMTYLGSMMNDRGDTGFVNLETGKTLFKGTAGDGNGGSHLWAGFDPITHDVNQLMINNNLWPDFVAPRR